MVPNQVKCLILTNFALILNFINDAKRAKILIELKCNWYRTAAYIKDSIYYKN